MSERTDYSDWPTGSLEASVEAQREDRTGIREPGQPSPQAHELHRRAMMSERERPYDRYRRDRRHDLRVVLLTRWEMEAAREALGEAVKRLPNPPKSVKQMAVYSAMEELKDAPCARIAEQEKRELVEALERRERDHPAPEVVRETYRSGFDVGYALACKHQADAARALLAKHEAERT